MFSTLKIFTELEVLHRDDKLKFMGEIKSSVTAIKSRFGADIESYDYEERVFLGPDSSEASPCPPSTNRSCLFLTKLGICTFILTYASIKISSVWNPVTKLT